MPGVTVSDVFFWFPEDGEPIPVSLTSSSSESENEALIEDNDEEENQETAEEKRNFWESQHTLLQSTLCRTSSLESKIRNATKEALKEIRQLKNVVACGCGGRSSPLSSSADTCRRCLMREVSGRLSNAGYNSAICKSKWRSSPDIPSGEHTFVDVIAADTKKTAVAGEVRIIIELNFRAEFEMARASEEYNRLVRRLPEVFVGKIERLKGVIKILCSAAKKCMKEKKMHMGPWRKQKYMQAKWLSITCERTTSLHASSVGSKCDSDRLMTTKPRVRASMLTVDLLEKMPNLHCTAVQVV